MINLGIDITGFCGFRNRRAVRDYSKFEYFQKRVIDYTMSIMLLITLTIPILYVIFRIRRESPGPILF